jgi:hypothetical protein
MANHPGHNWTRIDDEVWCPGTNEGSCPNPLPHDEHNWFNGPYGEQPFRYCSGIVAKPEPLPDGACGDPEPHAPHDWTTPVGDIHCVGVVNREAFPFWCSSESEHPEHNWVPDEGGQERYCPGNRPGEQADEQPEDNDPADMRYIRDFLVAEWWEQFHAKAEDYNDGAHENHKVLGIRGQFSDMWRKMGKLKKSIWDGKPLASEQPREIIQDLIGHCFLTLAMIDEEEGRRDG